MRILAPYTHILHSYTPILRSRIPALSPFDPILSPFDPILRPFDPVLLAVVDLGPMLVVLGFLLFLPPTAPNSLPERTLQVL